LSRLLEVYGLIPVLELIDLVDVDLLFLLVLRVESEHSLLKFMR
jgi:hypothetical protein